jgi:hypothetical protein
MALPLQKLRALKALGRVLEGLTNKRFVIEPPRPSASGGPLSGQGMIGECCNPIPVLGATAWFSAVALSHVKISGCCNGDAQGACSWQLQVWMPCLCPVCLLCTQEALSFCLPCVAADLRQLSAQIGQERELFRHKLQVSQSWATREGC